MLLNSPLHLPRCTVMNRLVAQPMERSAASWKGDVTDELLDEYSTLAAGHWGVLHIEAMTVMGNFKSRKGQLVISPENRPSIERLVKLVHEVSPGTKIILQVTFPGTVTGEGLEKTTIIPENARTAGNPRLLDDNEIMEIMDAFKQAIGICLESGADGVDIKACHGYLGAEFLRPANTRPGQFGGSFENRTRFFKELVCYARDEATSAGRNDFLVGSRISAWEGIVGGLGTAGPGEFVEDLGEVKRFTCMLADWGADFINVSAGIPATIPELTRPSSTVPWGVWNHFRITRDIKAHVRATGKNIAVIGSAYTMAGNEFVSYAESNLKQGFVDLVGLGRQTLADPHFAAKACQNRLDQANLCIACNSCARLLRGQRHVGCVKYNPKFKHALSDGEGK